MSTTQPMFKIGELPDGGTNRTPVIAPNERRAVEDFVAHKYPNRSLQGVTRDPHNAGGLWVALFNDYTWTWIQVQEYGEAVITRTYVNGEIQPNAL